LLIPQNAHVLKFMLAHIFHKDWCRFSWDHLMEFNSNKHI